MALGATDRVSVVGAVQQRGCWAYLPSHSARFVQFGASISTDVTGGGYYSARHFCVAPDCQLTLWVDGANRDEPEKTAGKHHGGCISNKEGD